MKPKITIFYADDDSDDLDIFRDVVNEIGDIIELHTYDRGDKLLNAVQNPPPSPQLIFLDLNMPGKNGFEVLKALKESEKYNTIPIIIFSTSSDNHNISKSREMGASYFITKQNTFDKIKKSIEHTLNIPWDSFHSSTDDFIYNQN